LLPNSRPRASASWQQTGSIPQQQWEPQDIHPNPSLSSLGSLSHRIMGDLIAKKKKRNKNGTPELVA
jgi:hypothetical protein